MKFDLFNWRELETDAESWYNQPKGRLQVMCSDPSAAVFVRAQGYEVLAGTGTKIDLELSLPVEVRVETEGRAFLYVPERLSLAATGEVFSNIDRQPHESGSVLAVKQAVRAMKLEHQALMREMRAEAAKAKQPKPPATPPAEPGEPVEPKVEPASPVDAE